MISYKIYRELLRPRRLCSVRQRERERHEQSANRTRKILTFVMPLFLCVNNCQTHVILSQPQNHKLHTSTNPITVRTTNASHRHIFPKQKLKRTFGDGAPPSQMTNNHIPSNSAPERGEASGDSAGAVESSIQTAGRCENEIQTPNIAAGRDSEGARERQERTKRQLRELSRRRQGESDKAK